jgi:hypothetical protein
MQKNIGPEDRIFRLVIAILLFAFAIWQNSIIATLAGLFVLYEALASWCVLYQLLGKNTCPIKKNDKK